MEEKFTLIFGQLPLFIFACGGCYGMLKREYLHLTVKSLYALICLYYSPDAFHFSKPIPLPKPKRKADHSALFDDWD